MNFRAYLLLAALTLIFSAAVISRMDEPGYADAYYYYNAGARLADGDGLTDPYLWNFVNAPDELPTSSHRYWMPLASLVAAIPMMLAGTGFHTAQVAFIPALIGLTWMGMWLGWRLGNSRRHAWIAGLSVAIGGMYLPFWLTTDTFALFGVIGCGALIALGLGRESNDPRWFALAGLLAALAHMTRADGMLFALVGVIVAIWPGKISGAKIKNTVVLLGTYLLAMLPLFLRNMQAFDAPLPSGGLGTIFLKGYNDIFSYPAEWPLQEFLDWGGGNILNSRIDGLTVAFGTWLAIEGFIILGPFALVALWKRRKEGFFAPMIWYALGLHVAMSLVFAYPGARGGLFHSSTALLPFWTVLGLLGIDDAVAKMASWRHWRIKEAQAVFGIAALFLPVVLGVAAWTRPDENLNNDPAYASVAESLPENARIMVNDPAGWYYHTGLMGVTLPDESLKIAEEIAGRYCITHLVVDINVTPAFEPLIRGENPPPFLTEIRHFEGENPDDWSDDVRIFAFDSPCAP